MIPNPDAPIPSSSSTETPITPPPPTGANVHRPGERWYHWKKIDQRRTHQATTGNADRQCPFCRWKFPVKRTHGGEEVDTMAFSCAVCKVKTCEEFHKGRCHLVYINNENAVDTARICDACIHGDDNRQNFAPHELGACPECGTTKKDFEKDSGAIKCRICSKHTCAECATCIYGPDEDADARESHVCVHYRHAHKNNLCIANI